MVHSKRDPRLLLILRTLPWGGCPGTSGGPVSTGTHSESFSWKNTAERFRSEGLSLPPLLPRSGAPVPGPGMDLTEPRRPDKELRTVPEQRSASRLHDSNEATFPNSLGGFQVEPAWSLREKCSPEGPGLLPGETGGHPPTCRTARK